MQLPSETAEQRTLTGAAFNRRSSNRHPRPIAETGLGRDVDRKVVKLRWQSPFENKPAAEVLYYLAQIHRTKTISVQESGESNFQTARHWTAEGGCPWHGIRAYSAIFAMWRSKPVFGSKDISSNALKPSPEISVWR